MERLIAEIIPIATAVALSPMPIVATLLILLSVRPRVNGITFLAGWILGLILLVFIMSSLISGSEEAAGSHSIRSIINGVLGVLLIIFALKQWEKRTRAGEKPKVPKWMASIESFSPLKSFAAGLGLATLNFKNTPLGIAAATIMSRADTAAGQIELLIVYLIIGSTTVAVPVIAVFLYGKKIQGTLNTLKEWLVYHNNAIMFVLFLILGALLLSKAFGG